MSRWWNVGRYERECAAFDAAHPLARALIDDCGIAVTLRLWR